MSTLTVAVVQLSSQEDVTHNLGRVAHWVAEAARAGARLVALPENFAFMGEEADKRALAESVEHGRGAGGVPGPIVGALVALAGKHGVYLVAGGMPERTADPDRPYNTSLLISPDGEIRARYRKIHLFDVELPDGTTLRESRASSAGPTSDDNLPIADVDGVPLAMTICYDVRFPELYRALAGKGARMVTVPSAFTLTTGKDHWHVLMRARAIENQVFVLAPAQFGKHPKGRQTYGKSLIVDPWGDMLAQCGEGEGFAVARVDTTQQDKVRAALPVGRHRRL